MALTINDVIRALEECNNKNAKFDNIDACFGFEDSKPEMIQAFIKDETLYII